VDELQVRERIVAETLTLPAAAVPHLGGARLTHRVAGERVHHGTCVSSREPRAEP
jgi:hypothetical protein